MNTKRSEAQPVEAAETTPLGDFLAHPLVRRWGPAVAIAVIAFVFLAPTLRGVFIWDDDSWLVNNQRVQDWAYYPRVWVPWLASHPEDVAGGNYLKDMGLAGGALLLAGALPKRDG